MTDCPGVNIPSLSVLTALITRRFFSCTCKLAPRYYEASQRPESLSGKVPGSEVVRIREKDSLSNCAEEDCGGTEGEHGQRCKKLKKPGIFLLNFRDTPERCLEVFRLKTGCGTRCGTHSRKANTMVKKIRRAMSRTDTRT